MHALTLKCKEQMEKTGLKMSDISTATKIPLSTVRGCFSESAKSPSLETMAQICAFLRVSIDDNYGIIRPGVSEQLDDHLLLDMKQENAAQAEVIKVLRADQMEMSVDKEEQANLIDQLRAESLELKQANAAQTEEIAMLKAERRHMRNFIFVMLAGIGAITAASLLYIIYLRFAH